MVERTREELNDLLRVGAAKLREQNARVDELTARVAELETLEAENAVLRGEIEILRGGLEHAGIDALAFLRGVYNSDAAPLNLKIQAAVAVAKIQATPKIQTNNFMLFDRLESARLAKRTARQIAVKTIDPDPAT
jgi:hypothetical protein